MSKSEIYRQRVMKGERPSQDSPITSWFEDDWFVCQIIKTGLEGMMQAGAGNIGGLVIYMHGGAADIDGKKIAALVRKANDRKIRFNDRP